MNIQFDGEVRFHTGIGEWDRVLGGGLTKGSIVLLAGDPGIGKSTLLLQALSGMTGDGPVLYVSGEESPQQLKSRAQRLGLCSRDLLIFSETSLEAVLDEIERNPPLVVAVDSIQTMYTRLLDVAPGSISQVRECASRLMRTGKEGGTSIFVVGHVTKEGAIAGPRALEHLVDTVLYLEGDRTHTFRLLRAVKNRYGSTNEVGVFEMKEGGLEEVPNPSKLLLAERPKGVSGSVVTVRWRARARSSSNFRPLSVRPAGCSRAGPAWESIPTGFPSCSRCSKKRPDSTSRSRMCS